MASPSAIRHHYDVGNDFFAAWLDESMTYSCALWQDDDDLETAQRRKLDYYVDQLRLRPRDRVLDVGCGWGSFLSRAAERVEIGASTGLTLSDAQRDLAVGRLAGLPVEVRVESWADHRPATPYHAIVSIGAFEHFARPFTSRHEHVATYGAFFAACHGLLVDGARCCVQTIALEDDRERRDSSVSRFFYDTIFPESSLPRLSEIVEAAEPWFRVLALRADPDDYARTTRAWRARLTGARHRLEGVADKATYDTYRKYLFLSEVQFVSRGCTLYRLTFERRPDRVDCSRPDAD